MLNIVWPKSENVCEQTLYVISSNFLAFHRGNYSQLFHKILTQAFY